VIQTRLSNLPLEAEHRLDHAGVHMHEIDSSFHDRCASSLMTNRGPIA
jgi:hypothetical protein